MKKHGWRTKFTKEEVTELKGLLKKNFSPKIIDELEAASKFIYNIVATTYVSHLKSEKERAKKLNRFSSDLLDTFTYKKYGPLLSPPENFKSYAFDSWGYKRLSSFIKELKAFQDLTLEFLNQDTVKKSPPRKIGDFSIHLARLVFDILSKHEVNISKGRGTTFYNVLEICFRLWGENKISDPYKQTKIVDDYLWPD